MKKPWITNKLPLRFHHFPSLEDPLPPVTIVGLGVAEFIACHKPFLPDFNVPLAVIHRKLKQSFNFQTEMKKRPFKDQVFISNFAVS